MNPTVPPLNLPSGVAADVENMMMRDGYIEPRPGFGFPLVTVTGKRVTHITPFRTDEGKKAAVTILSGTSFTGYDVDQGHQNIGAVPNVSTQSGDKYWWSSTVFEEPASSLPVTVITTGSYQSTFPPHTTRYNDGTFETFSLLSSFISSGESFAYNVATFDDRLLFFNTGIMTASPSQLRTRLRWSVRGNQLDFTGVGAGFEDLKEMRGFGTGLAALEDRLVIMSDEETWIALPRRDDYAFDTDVISDAIGCGFPRTVAHSPHGLLWISQAGDPVRMVGTEIRKFGVDIAEFLKRDMLQYRPQCVYARYDAGNDSYWIVYAPGGPTGAFSRAIQVYLGTLTQVAEGLDGVQWGRHQWGGTHSITEMRFASVNNDYGEPAVGDDPLGTNSVPLLGSSVGTVHQMLSRLTTDSGSTFAARWRSPAIRSQDQRMYESITEFWLDLDNSSVLSSAVTGEHATGTATVQFYTSQDQGVSFTAEGSVSATSLEEWPTKYLAMTAPAAQHQQFELRVLDGSRPRISTAMLTLRQYTGRWGGSR